MIVGSNILAGASGQQGYFLNRSVRLRSSASAYFTRTFGVPVSQNIWTYSVWVKRGALTGFHNIGISPNNQNTQLYFDSTSNTLGWVVNTATCFITTQVFRDPSAWYHIVLAFNGGAASNKVRLYVNGVEVTAFSTDNRSTTTTTSINTVVLQSIGNYLPSLANYFDGYLAEINFIDGQQLTPSSFGEFNSITGVWQPKKYVGTYGNNGFYLNFNDNSAATAAAIGKDSSGNGNNWTPNNISVTAGVTYDSMTDVPTLTSPTTANYATLNPLGGYLIGGPTLADGNLNYGQGAAAWSSCGSTFQPNVGKWYFEVSSPVSASNYGAGGLRAVGNIGASEYAGSTSGSYGAALTSAQLTAYSGGVAGGNITGTFSFATPIQIAVDFDSGKIWIGISNGTWIGGGNPVTGTTPTYTFTANTQLIPYVSAYANNVYFNSGQRPFIYTQPTGFKALNTYNLPTPTIANGADQFAATTYTGNGSTQTITNGGNNSIGKTFQPDFVWMKSRGQAYSNVLADAVRGVGKVLYSNATNAEDTGAYLTAFNSNGFSVNVTPGVAVNQNADSLIAWQWKASNAAAVTNTSGSISSQVSANPSAGFSIVTYAGNGTIGATIGHGLGVKPAMIIIKNRTVATVGAQGQNWIVEHQSLSGGVIANSSTFTTPLSMNVVCLNLTITSTSYGMDAQINAAGYNYVAYAFSEIAGYSKFGSYTGNGSTDGPFVYCGFRPRWILIKNASVGTDSWQIWDSARNTFNVTQNYLLPNTSGAEGSGSGFFVDFTANGFKIRTTNTASNGNTNTLIYAAFAENPFNYSLAR